LNSDRQKMIFKPLPSKRVFEEISDQIKEGIQYGLLQPGDKLPPERELSRQFNVSRMAVREAFRVLEDSGFIYIVKGSNGGAFIKAPDSSDVVKSIKTLLVRGGITLEQILEARLMIEVSSLELLIERITDVELKELQKNINTTDKFLRKGSFPSYIQTNFHVILARSLRNPLLETFLVTLMNLIVGFFGKGDPDDMEYSIRNLKDHRRIYRAIARKDLKAAKKILRMHILDVPPPLKGKGGKLDTVLRGTAVSPQNKYLIL
jgi:GntR family transcriptional repressor for pyruvate dehydrogenase complex